MAYNGLSLAEIMANAGQIKAQQQRSQLAGLQIDQAQRDASQSQAVDALTASNPDATLADYARVGGLQGVKASTDVAAARAADLTQKYRALYTAADSVVNSPDPVGAVNSNPLGKQFVQNYDAYHGPGAFSKLTPDQIKEQAAIVRDHALSGLVDPTKQFDAHQAMVLAHYKQEGPGGDAARNAATIAAENARTQFTQRQENSRAALSRAVTTRGQDLEAARAGVPAGYERDPNNPGALRPIIGGPHDPNATSAGMDSRSSVMFNRVAASANEAVQALKNIAELPVTTSTGWFGGAQTAPSLMGSVKSALAQKVTSQEAQDYKTMIAGVSRSLSTIETAGLAPNGSITHSMDSITLNEGDSQLTKLRKLAETRQIIEKGIEPNLANPKLAPAQRQLIERIISDVQGAIPFTQHDITKLQQSKNPNATLMDFAKQTGLPTAQAAPATSGAAPVKIAGDADYAKLPSGATYIAPDGSTRTKR